MRLLAALTTCRSHFDGLFNRLHAMVLFEGIRHASPHDVHQLVTMLVIITGRWHRLEEMHVHSAGADPEAALGIVGNAELAKVALEAKSRLQKALDALPN